MRAMRLRFLVHPTGSVLEQSVRDDRRELEFEIPLHFEQIWGENFEIQVSA